MSWNAGARLFRHLVEILQDNVDDEKVRVEVYREFIDIFESLDCENLKELYEETDDPAFDSAYSELYPELLKDDDGDE
jgi:hypothetical protein